MKIMKVSIKQQQAVTMKREIMMKRQLTKNLTSHYPRSSTQLLLTNPKQPSNRAEATMGLQISPVKLMTTYMNLFNLDFN